jgi:hypothetical protein
LRGGKAEVARSHEAVARQVQEGVGRKYHHVASGRLQVDTWVERQGIALDRDGSAACFKALHPSAVSGAQFDGAAAPLRGLAKLEHQDGTDRNGLRAGDRIEDRNGGCQPVDGRAQGRQNRRLLDLRDLGEAVAGPYVGIALGDGGQDAGR